MSQPQKNELSVILNACQLEHLPMTFTDQLQRSVQLPVFPPQRIISLVPSQTELLYHLGLEKEVIGITKFCIHPDHWFRTKTRIGGTKQLSLDQIQKLQPDLIIGNKEENEKEQIIGLEKQFPVWLSDVQGLPDAYQMIKQIGALTDKSILADTLVDELQQRFSSLSPSEKKLRVAYFIWRNPFMVVGNNTFIHQMIQEAGFRNAFEHKSRYPEIQLDELLELDIDLIFLSSEPYPFKKKHFEDFIPFCQQAVIKIVDGELFSWYGSRLLHSAHYFEKLKKDLDR